MYEDFHVTDRWSGEDLHCSWKGTIVAIATRHADAVDVRFDVNGRPMWIALPCAAWVEQKQRTGKVITDQLAAQIAGRYLKQLVEEGYDSRREVYIEGKKGNLANILALLVCCSLFAVFKHFREIHIPLFTPAIVGVYLDPECGGVGPFARARHPRLGEPAIAMCVQTERRI
jgi:hypothetical protein